MARLIIFWIIKCLVIVIVISNNNNNNNNNNKDRDNHIFQRALTGCAANALITVLEAILTGRQTREKL